LHLFCVFPLPITNVLTQVPLSRSQEPNDCRYTPHPQQNLKPLTFFDCSCVMESRCQRKQRKSKIPFRLPPQPSAPSCSLLFPPFLMTHIPPFVTIRCSNSTLQSANGRMKSSLPRTEKRFVFRDLGAKFLYSALLQVLVDGKIASMEGRVHDIAWAPQTGVCIGFSAFLYICTCLMPSKDRDACFIAAGAHQLRIAS
jgi:hypothetical protein